MRNISITQQANSNSPYLTVQESRQDIQKRVLLLEAQSKQGNDILHKIENASQNLSKLPNQIKKDAIAKALLASFGLNVLPTWLGVPLTAAFLTGKFGFENESQNSKNDE